MKRTWQLHSVQLPLSQTSPFCRVTPSLSLQSILEFFKVLPVLLLSGLRQRLSTCFNFLVIFFSFTKRIILFDLISLIVTLVMLYFDGTLHFGHNRLQAFDPFVLFI